VLRRIPFLLVGLVPVLALGLLVAPRIGWATPFGLPSTLHFDGRDYIGPGCVRRLKANERPLRKIGSVFGYFTGSKPILEPHYEWHLPNGLIPTVIYVRGDCLTVYGLSGGP
jgi:hypothetical protein